MADLNAAGTITATDGTVEIAPGDNAAVAVALEGTWTATVNFEVTYDGVRWDAAQVFTLAGVAAAATATTNVDRLIDARGVERVRVRANPYTSGTITVSLSAGEGVVAAGGGGGGGAVTIADGANVAQGATTDTAAADDTGAATLLALFKRLLQRITVLIAQLPSTLVGGRLDVNIGGSGVTQAVSGTVIANAGTGPFPIQATAAAPGSVELSDGAAFYTGAKTGQLPAALVGGRLDVNLGGSAATQTVTGAATPADAASNPTTTVPANAYPEIWDTINSQWNRLINPPTDGSTAPCKGALLVCSGFFNGTNQLTLQRNASNELASSLIGAYGLYAYNGSSHERLRSNIITNINNGAVTVTTNHATQTNYTNSGLLATLNITAVSGTTPTLDIKLQVADGAGTFFDYTDSAGNAVAFAQKTGTGTDTLKLAPGLVEKLTTTGRQYAGQLGRSYRFVSTVGGTTPSFTFRLDVSEYK